MKRYLTGLALAGLLLTGAACDKRATPEQLRPTYGGLNGECMEADDEPCDDDPFDTDDSDIHLPKPTKKASPRPMMTANQPAPTRPTVRKTTAPAAPPAPIRTTKRR